MNVFQSIEHVLTIMHLIFIINIMLVWVIQVIVLILKELRPCRVSLLSIIMLIIISKVLGITSRFSKFIGMIINIGKKDLLYTLLLPADLPLIINHLCLILLQLAKKLKQFTITSFQMMPFKVFPLSSTKNKKSLKQIQEKKRKSLLFVKCKNNLKISYSTVNRTLQNS